MKQYAYATVNLSTEQFAAHHNFVKYSFQWFFDYIVVCVENGSITHLRIKLPHIETIRYDASINPDTRIYIANI